MESETDEVPYEGELHHIGIKRRSGRYPWGSGQDPQQRSRDFKSWYEDLKSQGMKDTEIAGVLHGSVAPGEKPLNFKTTDLRAAIAVSTDVIRAENVNMATRLKDKGMSTTAIAERMGLGKSGESTVRGWLKTTDEIKEGSLRATADRLKEEVAEKKFLDVGKGNHLYMGITETKLRTALTMLKDEGYEVHPIRLPLLGSNDKFVNYRVLAKPGTSWHDTRDAVVNGKVRVIASQSDDGGHTFMKIPKAEPVTADLKRVEVAWREDGGHLKDGVIELRRDVEDLSMGAARYAQIRMSVNGSHYLKGMAIHADDLPSGVDIRFNTNKSKNDPKVIDEGKKAGDLKLGAMKPLKDDPENRFGAQTRPRTYINKKGEEKTSLLNIVNEEGKWDEWTDTLSSQMLSKQSLTLASTQLAKARTKREEDLGKIRALTNDVVREKLLREFSDAADAAAVHLKAAAVKDQGTHVILPMNSIRPNEVYAPNFENGQKVVLIRFPHGGPFEIPELTVNNSNREARRLIKGAKDAVGIHHSVAEQLSGADFDGDTVLVIPNDNRKIKTRPPLEGLKGFDAKVDYAIPKGDTSIRRMSKSDTQREMGRISNLITDMTIHKANDDELARAIRHSMVVIDAEKHELNYKLSEQVNGIAALKKTYQGATGGASTIISRAGADRRVPQQKQLSGKAGINPKTGEKVFIQTGHVREKAILDKNGKPTGKVEIIPKTTKGTRAEFVKDARRLLSGGDENSPVTSDRGQPIERIYADYSNSMKALANTARKELVAIKPPKQSAAARAVYASELRSLDAKLKIALANAPLERRAQLIGNAHAKARIDANPGLDKEQIRTIKYQAREDARNFTGAKKKAVFITEREWEAIQAGGVSATKLRSILDNADMDRVRELASPRPRTRLSSGQQLRAEQLAASGRSLSEIAAVLDIPRSTIADFLKT